MAKLSPTATWVGVHPAHVLPEVVRERVRRALRARPLPQVVLRAGDVCRPGQDGVLRPDRVGRGFVAWGRGRGARVSPLRALLRWFGPRFPRWSMLCKLHETIGGFPVSLKQR